MKIIRKCKAGTEKKKKKSILLLLYGQQIMSNTNVKYTLK